MMFICSFGICFVWAGLSGVMLRICAKENSSWLAMNKDRVKQIGCVGVFKKIAKQINSNEKINPHEYEEELEQRN